MNPSKDHINWITVGEVINLIRKPIAFYTSHIVQKWHATLCKDCLRFGRCANPGNCETKTKHPDLCLSCNGWYKELAKWHHNKVKRQIEWRKNCDTSKWPDDPWEVAKFFMPPLGGNKRTTKDAESTDLSSLLNVLIWMKDVAFAPDRRVDLNLVKKLRSEVINPWAHSPNQELSDAEINNAFDIGNKFVADLDKVFSCVEVRECTMDIQFVEANGISNVVEAELKTLKLLGNELGAEVCQMKIEIKNLKENQSVDKQVIKEHENILEKFVNRTEENRADIKSLQETNQRLELKSRLPDKPPIFIGREAEVNKIISSLVEDSSGIVSIVGGPGFGKSTVAREVSHRLSNNHDIIVIFSFLSNVSTVPELKQRLCHDVGVVPGEDPESSLMFWLKGIEKKVVLVMDNIEQLLESNVRSQFTELVRSLRKNSQQQLQVVTTTRTVFSILGQTTKNVHIEELDEKSGVELLQTCCPNEDVQERYLSSLANLCGFVPLALCIVGSQIQDLVDPAELIEWLREKPMEVLQTSDNSECVQNAIEFSFRKLNIEDRVALVRLAVFDGNFQMKSAQEVIERNGLKTQHFLNNLVTRSLMQRSSNKRFLIHSLIRRFLSDHDVLQNEKSIAQGLMVDHFLKMCHSLTMASYSKDGYTGAREKMKQDAHNLEEALKLCIRDQATNLNPNISESLASSDIYTFSSRFFYRVGRDLFAPTVLRNFHECCINLAKTRKELAVEITFQCLVADQEGRKFAWKSTEYIDRMEAIKEAFESNRAVLKKDRSLFCYCYYFYARYYSNNKTNSPTPDLQEDDLTPLSKNEERHPIQKIDEALVLIQRARLNKNRASRVFHPNREKYKEYMNCAQSFYNQALSSAKELLGDHELTCLCHKLLGDLYFTLRKNEEALTYYSDAIRLGKKLQLDSNESFVYLLKNYGSCLCFLGRFDESVEKLNEARDIAEKLADKDTPCRANVYYELAKRFSRRDYQEAAKYAKMAMEMHALLDKRSVETMKDIIKKAEENMP